MDHIERRLLNFIKYRPGITPILHGQFIDDAVKNPEKYRQGFWAVNCAIDQFPALTLAATIKEHNLHTNCVYLVADQELADQYRDLNFRYFPYCIAEGIAQIKHPNQLENPEIDFVSRKNILSCVNRFARFHRLYAFYRICRSPNLQDAKVSFMRLETRWPDENGILQPVLLSFEDMIEVSKVHDYYSADFESWLRDEFPRLPRQIEELDNIDNKYDNWVKSEAFSESYANITTETYVEYFVPTEKVVKPLLAGCLFMPTSSKSYMKKMELMGFDLKFDGLDYNQYDELPTWQQRVDRVVEIANDLYADIPDIWRANVDRLKYNRSLYWTQDLERHVIDDVRDIFELNY